MRSCYLISVIFLLSACQPSKQGHKTSQNKIEIVSNVSKIHGVNYVSTSQSVTPKNFSSLEKINAKWVAIIPFSYMRDNDAHIYFNSSWQWYGETPEGSINYIQSAQKKDLKVLLKPHIWPSNGWIGDLDFQIEEDWGTFEETYENYILTFAKIAQDYDVDMFCIGVEMKKIVIERPKYFKTLIKKVRDIYKGQLTYAANWDNYKNITFWNELDYIGIDGYFPLNKEKTPTVAETISNWKPIEKQLSYYSDSLKKQILFTEYGYRNIDFSGKQPWIDNNQSSNNEEAQSNLYQAFYQSIWKQNWFAGGFLWKWYPNHQNAGGKNNNRFTPQNKAAEKVIKEESLK